MSLCKICRASLKPIISFGRMPIANRLVTDLNQPELFYHLSLNLCPKCLMVQIGQTIKPSQNFRPDYPYLSSTSTRMQTHFKSQAEEIIRLVKNKPSPFIIELGSNDGIMLKHLKRKKIRHLGIEPCTNIAKISQKLDINTVSQFFNLSFAEKIKRQYGPADIICGSSTVSHINNLNSVFKGFYRLLKPNGLVFFEDSYLLDIVNKLTFDQIYDEHVYFFSALSIHNLARKHGFSLIDLKHQFIHGGCMRFYLKKGIHRQSAAVAKQMSKEKKAGLHLLSGYKTFNQSVNKICSDLKKLLIKLKNQNHTIVGYGATAKSTTLLNYAQIGPNLIDYISDTTPAKINQCSPGMHIPIKSYHLFKKHPPDYALLFAWNHMAEIFTKEKTYRQQGGKFILYFPKLKII